MDELLALRAERDAALAELESCRKDAERLNLLADHVVIEGFVGVEKDIYDLSCGVAEGNGREEPSEDDQRQAFRLLIDAFRAKEAPNA
ncbi:hypothetical protein QM298_14120 [Pseudomonas mendocina]|nr:hypothetical protein [Pseudomonas mendocina]MDV5862015.1 hypothetical protein [Pseudomonas mendocina]